MKILGCCGYSKNDLCWLIPILIGIILVFCLKIGIIPLPGLGENAEAEQKAFQEDRWEMKHPGALYHE